MQADDEVVTVQAVENCVVRVIEHVNSAAVITKSVAQGFEGAPATFA